MLARRPSLQHQYEFISEHDDAIIAERGDEFAHALQVARDTGSYALVLAEGKQPTRFVLHPLDVMASRRLLDDHMAGRVGMTELLVWAYRAALESVASGDFDVKHEKHERYGRVATLASVEAIHDSVINEIGMHVWNRAMATPPKS